ncbi:MAG: SDR family oxidoreductase [Candidatus Heimdallarchaeota archaeon]|nr:SDR family oxidoreductase [Candidatus Heimdallarchaeota archaeon]MCK5049163.1 SDR family oxidoreductase [Candidatus Heimdallarchaeota archaeon]
MKNKVCMITGANSGIGKETALQLAKLGSKIIMVCRDKVRGEKALSDIISQSGNNSVELFISDLSSLHSVRKLAFDFLASYERLDVLINNAGVLMKKRTLTIDGLESTFVINHLSHFLLTQLLLDILKESAPARIINVSGDIHKFVSTIDFEDLNGDQGYGAWNRYNQSKLANILFTYEMARKLDPNEVTINALHPGVVRTNLVRSSIIMKFFSNTLGLIFMKNPRKGAKTTVFLASSPEVEGISGKYFINKKEKKSSKASYNLELQKTLWDASEELIYDG